MENPAHIIQDEVAEEKTELAPHILLLQQFLGQQFAERFLDTSYEIPVNPVHPLHLEAEGCGAKDYWRLLREHSETRLTRDIADVPGAITVKSSGWSLLPPSKFQDQIKDYRRKLWLMSRTSEINQEKALLFITNNPLPEERQDRSTRLKGPSKGSLGTKHISHPGKTFNLPPLKATNSLWTTNEHTSDDQAMAAANNFRFLTEESFCGSNGGFSIHYSGKSVQRQRSPLKGPYRPLTHRHQSSIYAEEDGSSCSTAHGLGGSPAWEPLTYTALMDSRPSRTVPGKGPFRHGQPAQWLVSRSTIQESSDTKVMKV